MNERQWKEIVDDIEQKSFETSTCVLTGCCTGCMACVYGCVLKGWTEHRGTLNENIKGVGKCVFNWYNQWCNDYGIAAMADVMWGINSGKFDVNWFKSSYTNFMYDVGMLTDALVCEKKDVETLVWYVVCDYIDIVSMFMSQKEFYNLMMDKEEESENEMEG